LQVIQDRQAAGSLRIAFDQVNLIKGDTLQDDWLKHATVGTLDQPSDARMTRHVCIETGKCNDFAQGAVGWPVPGDGLRSSR